MAFPIDLTSTLTGVTPSQLASWRTKGLLRPEVSSRPVLYSFRDLLALRSMAKLRSEISLQRIRAAFSALEDLDLTEHPSRYDLYAFERKVVIHDNGQFLDLSHLPGHALLASLDEVMAPFTNFRGDEVVDMRRPAPNLEVRERRMGGWPTIVGTRIRYDTVAALAANGVDPSSMEMIYPKVTPSAVRDAVEFDARVSGAYDKAAA